MKTPIVNLLLQFCTGLYLFTVLSCSTPKYISQNRLPMQTDRMALMKPVSEIFLVQAKDKLQHSDSLNNVSNDLLNANIRNITTYTGILNLLNSSVHMAEEGYLAKECLAILQYRQSKHKAKEKKKFLQTYRTNPQTDSAFTKLGVNTVFFVKHSGFKRTKKNYRKQNIKNFSIGLLTLGMYIPIAYPFSSQIEVIALSKSIGISYFNTTIVQKDPTNANKLRGELCNCFKGYLSKKSNTRKCFYYN